MFGSYAWGNPDPDSDLDFLIVTDDDFIPSSFKEKNILYLKFSNTITDIEQEVLIDLIIHTKPMHNLFINENSSFARQILNKGVKLYEKGNPALA
ncbi:unnamed protein product [marine sediment metagenome]|uniref:Polymerase beta nucleotidyltransferase domain-containing protein n=1 Tax=marine sediment metagenome TaxID=412755 RepID=X1MM42_9ZZZZ